MEICKKKHLNGECGKQHLETFPFRNWTHLCGVFQVEDVSEDGTARGFATLYVNGRKGNTSKSWA